MNRKTAQWDIYHKQCSNCHKVKPVSEFYRKRAAPDGYQYECKPCRTEICYAWKNKNKPAKIERYFEEKEKT